MRWRAFKAGVLLSLVCGLVFVSLVEVSMLFGPSGNTPGGWILFPVFFGAPWAIGAVIVGALSARWVLHAWRVGCAVIALDCALLALGCQERDLRFLLPGFGAAGACALALAIVEPGDPMRFLKRALVPAALAAVVAVGVHAFRA